MQEFDRVLTLYEHRLRQLADEIMAELDPSPEERAHLVLVTRLVQSIVRAYGVCQISRSTSLDASTSVMYAAAGQEGRGVLNVPMRSLVDSGTLSPAQARFLNGNLGLKRSMFISGGENVGKSTLMNALIGLLPNDLRLVVIREDTDQLPALSSRSFVVQIAAPSGTPERETAFREAGAARPDWIVCDRLQPADSRLFVEALTLDTGGLATVSVADEETSLIEWLLLPADVMGYLDDLNPLAVHLERDRTGRPRITSVVELVLKDARRLAAARSRL